MQDSKNSFSHDVGQMNIYFAYDGKIVFCDALRLCWVGKRGEMEEGQ